MTPEQFCAQAALGNAAQWVSLGIEIPPANVVGVAVIEYCGMRVTVTIEREKPPGPAPVPLREIEQAIYDKAPMPVEVPVTVKRLASMCGYCCNTYFRDAVRRLVDMGLLKKCTGGVKRA